MSKVWNFLNKRNITFFFQALDQEPTEKNRQNTAGAIKPLTEAVENLTTFASSPEFASIPAKISQKVFVFQNMKVFFYIVTNVIYVLHAFYLCEIEIFDDLILIYAFIPIVFIIIYIRNVLYLFLRRTRLLKFLPVLNRSSWICN